MALFFLGQNILVVWTLIRPDAVSIEIRTVPIFRRSKVIEV